MKNIIIVFLCSLMAFNAIGQGNIGIGTRPNGAAQLDISATDKGLLIPRIMKANRPAIPTEGLLIYQTDNTPGF